MAIEAVTARLAPIDAADAPRAAQAPAAGAAGGITDSFAHLLDKANASDGAANAAVGRMLDGSGDVHEAMIALQQADLLLQFTVQVRNKLVQAYQDIMRMPV
jgi:flagellar hook-basal body complex protein FliE